MNERVNNVYIPQRMTISLSNMKTDATSSVSDVLFLSTIWIARRSKNLEIRRWGIQECADIGACCATMEFFAVIGTHTIDRWNSDVEIEYFREPKFLIKGEASSV